jgi:hypothetical protein
LPALACVASRRADHHRRDTACAFCGADLVRLPAIFCGNLICTELQNAGPARVASTTDTDEFYVAPPVAM